METDPYSRKGRLMGKLFGRDRKASNELVTEQNNSNVNDFLHGPSDRLQVNHAPPAPRLPPKLDTLSVSRYPNALQVKSASQQSLPLRPTSSTSQKSQARSPRRKRKKGLVVRFVDTAPEIIGIGGDESEVPPAEVGRQRQNKLQAQSSNRDQARGPGSRPNRPADMAEQPSAYSELTQQDPPQFSPGPLRRTQTGYSTISSPGLDLDRATNVGNQARPRPPPHLDSLSAQKDENRKSFIEMQQAHMREAEGLAFAKAVRSASGSGDPFGDPQQDGSVSPTISSDDSPIINRYSPPPYASPEKHSMEGPPPDHSPSSIYSTASSFQQLSQNVFRQDSKASARAVPNSTKPNSPQRANMSLHDVIVAAGDDAYHTFVSRTKHLFELFRLHSETSRPLSSCTAEVLARTALWWFLQGRMALENAIRDRSTNSQGQRSAEMVKQQAYADLAKGYWLSEEVLPETLETKQSPLDGEVDMARKSLVSNLRKLSMSMQRNGFLPPEEAFLPQTIDKSIWVNYPPVSQDIIALLWGCWGSSLTTAQTAVPPTDILGSLPLGDSSQDFSFGRVRANVFLMEQGRELQRFEDGMECQSFHFPCLLSMIRPVEQTNLNLVLTSQNGAVQMLISENNKNGPNLFGLSWRADSSSLKMTLPRGFVLVIQLSLDAYKTVWGMYDFATKVVGQLRPRQDEETAFRSTLKAFQYFDADPQARMFPKEAVPECEVALFERTLKHNAATGPRIFHRGFRVAIVTGARTRTLSGVSHSYVPPVPVQFGFLRSENNHPALLLKFDSNRSKGSMVLSFANEDERLRFHSLLVGTALRSDERVFCEVPLTSYAMSLGKNDAQGLPPFNGLAYQRVRAINFEDENEGPPQTVLADKLRMVVEFKNGTIADRINVATGELKIRLNVRSPNTLAILRQRQQDMTIAISEAQVPRSMPQELTDSLQTLTAQPSVRTLQFTNLQDLHEFQEAITGFKVLFDAVASTLSISRRRMVVPIHKKWEASAVRIQVVRQETVTQLLVFFQDFHHGDSMSFVLKGTDIFESFGKNGKAGLKIDDAKFPLPRLSSEVGDDAAFVCIDAPELPGEHDDITMVFEKEADRDKLVSCLPAATRSSRLKF